jgi:ATP-binding protein involved in chromosome partitioning
MFHPALQFHSGVLTSGHLQITGILLNQSYFICPTCTAPHHLFGSPDAFRETATHLGLSILGELPLVQGVSSGGDQGVPYALVMDDKTKMEDGVGGVEWKGSMERVASKVWTSLSSD